MQFVDTVDGEWIKPETLDDLMAVLDSVPDDQRYILIAGNTVKGEEKPSSLFLDISV